MTNEPSITSSDAQTHLDQAYLYEERGDYENALQECDAAIRVDPKLPDTHNLRGIVLEELGRKKEAIEAYQEALRLDPRFSTATKNLAALEAELLLTFVGPERARRIRLLETTAIALRILAWVALGFETLAFIYNLVSMISQVGLYVSTSPDLYLGIVSILLTNVLIGAIAFTVLLALSAICKEIAESAKTTMRSQKT